ncbi:MAG: EGF domain-containing protein [Polyangiaceae bacterium]
MRRSFSLALASLTLGVGSILVAAQGCNNSTALGVQDLCGWIADECNCYRRFAAGVAPSGATGQKPLCGVQLDASHNAIDPTTGMPFASQNDKPTKGTFLSRDKLDICILTGSQGGQIVFDPPLDPAALPPATMGFKILTGNGELCATGSYESITSFSIGFPAADGTGAGGSTGGAGGTGGSTASGSLCRGDGGTGTADPSKDAITSGTFTMAKTDIESVVTTTCPNDESHKFNLYQLNECDGTSANEGSYKALLPTAEIEATAGGVGIPGEVKLRIFWPPTAPVASLDGVKPTAVEYFDCTFPGSIHPCLNGVQDGAETDVDCGDTACGVGCPNGANCVTEKDCISGICSPNDKGLKKCVATPCGDSLKSGPETCDDGNTTPGDGCSAECQQEPGWTCTGAGPGTCHDIDECAMNTDNCAADAVCANTQGSFTCTCNSGFSGDGTMCTAGCGDGAKGATEECDDDNTMAGDGCDPNCKVETGWMCMGVGPGSCVDIDECKSGAAMCATNETCTNMTPGFTCTCDAPNLACAGVCTKVQEDVNHCGTCDKVCNPGQTCMAGTCQ